MTIRAFVFDAYGTLYDVQSVLERVERACPGRGALITQIWRLKQLEYTWLRTCMEDFANFAVVTRDSLVYALHVAGVEPAEALVTELEDAYLHLTPAPEAHDSLRALEGHTRAIFSNGSVAMLDALVLNTGLKGLLEHVVSVDSAKVFKPSPKAYALLEPVIGVPPNETMFVSSNGFDVAGAKRFGFQVAWVRRGGGPGTAPADAGPTDMFKAQRLHAEMLNAKPDHVLGSLTELVDLR
ncbi:haloacid dehalogenase type II [Rhodopila sp.]|uniref:haloacid dehalogenase type II n=1 Tax=Rhodopila sp. TaxID=2480087 RepID=UPI003D0D9AD1